MAKTSTTLAGAIGPSDVLVNTANNAALRPGDNIVVGTETMKALVVDTAIGALVYRGARGTAGQAAAGGATLTYGPPADWGPGIGVTSLPMEFEPEAAREVAAEDAEKLAERVEKKRKELVAKAAEKAAADAKAAEAAEKAAEKADGRAEKNERASAHR
jgi:hypothetical protein